MKDSKKTVLDYALEYYKQGWCIIPIRAGTKRPALRSWKPFQTTRPDEKQLRKCFANNNRNIAVIVGEVSNGLTCRDFDAMAEYKQWAKNYPDLAKILPTVQTAKGMHVYFEGHIEGIDHITNGELRGSRCYCLLPPSVHPDGQVYQWVNPPYNGNILRVDPELAGFLGNTGNVTERADENVGELKEIYIDGKVEKAIVKTLPTRFRTRHRKIFDLARELKSMPEYTDADPQQFRAVVREWHKRALPYIRTKEFEETWIDFLKAWPRIRYKKGEEPMAQIFEKAIQLEPPRIAVEKYPNHSKLKVLVSLCKELQRAAGNSPFFLSARTAARLLNSYPMEISRWFFLLEIDGILKVIAKGKMTIGGGIATRFKYIAN